MAIPESFLDELNSRVNIVDVVSSYLPLNKKGANYWGLCPFHHEKTPSFSVNESKQIFHCFGCGKGGGAINFMMEMDSLLFVDAVKVLAKRVNMEVPETGYSPGMRERREKLLELIWKQKGDLRTVDVHIRRLREKIEEEPAHPQHILTKWGVGYYFSNK